MITDFASLSDSITDELAREDLRGKIPEWIQLAEIWIARRLRTKDGEQFKVMTFTPGQAWFELPAGFKLPRHIEIQSQPLRILDVITLDKRSDVLQNDVGTQPRAVTFLGTRAWLAPPPQTAETFHFFYYGMPPFLSETNTVNEVVTNAPDLLKWAALCHSATWMHEDTRLNTWISLRDETAKALSTEVWDARVSSKTRTRPDFAPRDGHR